MKSTGVVREDEGDGRVDCGDLVDPERDTLGEQVQLLLRGRPGQVGLRVGPQLKPVRRVVVLVGEVEEERPAVEQSGADADGAGAEHEAAEGALGEVAVLLKDKRSNILYV